MNSTASAVMTCSVAERATMNCHPPSIPSGAQRGWPDDHGVMDRGAERGCSDDPLTRFPARSMSPTGWYGGRRISRKTVSPPFLPRTYPHRSAPLHTDPGRVGEPPAMVLAEGQATEWIVREEQVAVQVDPVGE